MIGFTFSHLFFSHFLSNETFKLQQVCVVGFCTFFIGTRNSPNYVERLISFPQQRGTCIISSLSAILREKNIQLVLSGAILILNQNHMEKSTNPANDVEFVSKIFRGAEVYGGLVIMSSADNTDRH